LLVSPWGGLRGGQGTARAPAPSAVSAASAADPAQAPIDALAAWPGTTGP
jgi:hypothetical protein